MGPPRSGEKNKVPENLAGGSLWTGSLGGRGQRERTEWCAMEREGFFERKYELVRQFFLQSPRLPSSPSVLLLALQGRQLGRV